MLGLLGASEGFGATTLVEWAAIDLVVRCALGVLAGVAVGCLAGRYLPGLRDRGSVSTGYAGILIIGLALLAYGAGS